jgi:hypothetical protein
MNRAQELQLLRLRMGSFNAFDGNAVADDLQGHEELWDAFVFGRFEFQPLIELRDLKEGFVNADTIFSLTRKEKLRSLLDLVKNWKADEVGWRTGNLHGGGFVCNSPWHMLGAELGNEDALVRVWWD